MRLRTLEVFFCSPVQLVIPPWSDGWGKRRRKPARTTSLSSPTLSSESKQTPDLYWRCGDGEVVEHHLLDGNLLGDQVDKT